MNSAPANLVAALGDRYRLERELGKGGMATVYLAQEGQSTDLWVLRAP